MTQNQLTYWRNQEEIRSNKENEAIKRDTLAETARANQKREEQYDRELTERERTDRENESINWGKLNETIRFNTETNQLRRSELDERIRSDIMGEALKASQLAFEKQQWRTEWPFKQQQYEANVKNLGAQALANEARAAESKANAALTDQKLKTEEYNTDIAKEKVNTQQEETYKTHMEGFKAETEGTYGGVKVYGETLGNIGKFIAPFLGGKYIMDRMSKGGGNNSGKGGSSGGNDSGFGFPDWDDMAKQAKENADRYGPYSRQSFGFDFSGVGEKVKGLVKDFIDSAKDTVEEVTENKTARTLAGIGALGATSYAIGRAMGGMMDIMKDQKAYNYH